MNRHVDQLLTKTGFADVTADCCLAAAQHWNDNHTSSFTQHDSSLYTGQHVYSLLDLKDGESALWRVRRSRASARWRSSGRPGQGRAAETAARLQCAAPFSRHAKSCMLAAPAGVHAASSSEVRFIYLYTKG